MFIKTLALISVYFLSRVAFGEVFYEVVDPFESFPVMPEHPVNSGLVSELAFDMCADEIESGSFVLLSDIDYKDLIFEISPLVRKGGGDVLENAFDLRIVKRWYQNSNAFKTVEYGKSGDNLLVPELLLKNDGLVKVIHRKRENSILIAKNNLNKYYDLSSFNTNKIKQYHPDAIDFNIDDSKDLLPFDLIGGSAKQIWVNVELPKYSHYGEYVGLISLKSGAELLLKIPVKVIVRNFLLGQADVEYSIYYRGQLRKGLHKISSEYKNEEQLTNDLKNMKDHGISNPTIYQKFTTPELIDDVLRIRSGVGFPNDNIYYLGMVIGHRFIDENDELESAINLIDPVFNKYDVNNYYVYAIEERKGKELVKIREHLKVAQNKGLKTFVAGYEGTLGVMSKYLDVFISKTKKIDNVSKEFMEKRKILTHKPQVGVENPMLYRTEYGVELWKSGLDGAMPYSYQGGFGFIWDDNDNKRYRDHNFTYPTVSGVIDTISWEAFREGVDDMRYLNAAEKFISSESTPSDRKITTGKLLDEIKSGELIDPRIIRDEISKVLSAE